MTPANSMSEIVAKDLETSDHEKRSLLAKAWWVLRHRPGQVLQLSRGYLLFLVARVLRRLVPLRGVTLESNVRLQKNSSLVAEAPHASISVGADSIIYEDTKIEAYGTGKVNIGRGSVLGGARVVSRYGISLGDRFLASWNVFIQDFDPHPIEPSLRAAQIEDLVHSFRPRFDSGSVKPTKFEGWNFPGESISIGSDVWVGANATILKGARIGDGCIIATGSVVLRGDYPPRSVIAGNPARVVKELKETP